ncbi:hypothetical protein [Komagataeibacter saccharivorans]|uniref:hypothetical protein n=1 Tax=Komagataeibacter saccharivorans TaxID=265959 RepID=UPI0011B4FC01|nr:hypothetical protein [Komagataeibacter saccharivorans]
MMVIDRGRKACAAPARMRGSRTVETPLPVPGGRWAARALTGTGIVGVGESNVQEPDGSGRGCWLPCRS